MGRGRPAKNAKNVQKDEIKIADGRSVTVGINVTPNQQGEILTAPPVLMEAKEIKATTPIGASGAKEAGSSNEGAQKTQRAQTKGKEQEKPASEIWPVLPVRVEGTKTPLNNENTPTTMGP
ncbi:hypothetical protein A4A49_61826, partial [Nicotiana attenuata]